MSEIVDTTAIVRGIMADDPAAVEALYALFNRGIRYYLCRQLGPQELEDRLHDTFIIVVSAIRRGDLREPEKLFGFVRTVVRRQVAEYIAGAMKQRRDDADAEIANSVPDRKHNPEQEIIVREKATILRAALATLSHKDRDILDRFYLREQTKEEICADLHLTDTQYRLLKSRAKGKLSDVGRWMTLHLSAARIRELAHSA